MILPTKHISTRKSLVGVGWFLLDVISEGQTVSQLWEQVRSDDRIGSYGRFVLALDLLYMVGALDVVDGELRRQQT